MIQIAGCPRPKPKVSGKICVCIIAITAEVVASRAPTLRSMWRLTITKTMPQAMIATDTVWIVRLKILRGVRKRPSVNQLNPMQRMNKAPIMPRRRISSSSFWNRLPASFSGIGAVVVSVILSDLLG